MDLCRSKGVISFKSSVRDEQGDLVPFEFLFGPPPMSEKQREEEDAKSRDPRARKRQHYKDLLGRENITDKELDQLPDGY